MTWIRANLKILAPLGIGLVAVVAYLAFAVFGVHTLFIDDKVDEAGPVFASGAASEPDEPATETTTLPEATVPVTEVPPSTTPVPADSDVPVVTEAPIETDVPVVTEAPVVTEPPEPQIVTLVEGGFIPRGRYSGEGQALVLNDGSEQRFLRFENFATDNGPDLNVYLVNSDANADKDTFDDDFIDLGELKGNIGDQNYEISPDVDLAVYDTVVIWCVRFSTAFAAADLVPAA